MENPWIVVKDGVEKPVLKLDDLEYADPSYPDLIRRKTTSFLRGGSKRKMNLFSCAMFAREFDQKAVKKVSIQYIDSLIGFGVFADERIPALQYVGEYVGVVRKNDKSLDRDNSYIFRYLKVGLFSHLVIDAEEKGNFTRFINHSDEPNLTSRWVVVDGIYHIILFSNRLIDKGAQLTYNYGPGYWSRRAKPLKL